MKTNLSIDSEEFGRSGLALAGTLDQAESALAERKPKGNLNGARDDAEVDRLVAE